MSLKDILPPYFDAQGLDLEALQALWDNPASYTLPKDNYAPWETDERNHEIGVQTELALSLWHLETLVTTNPRHASIFENIETLWERLYGKPRNFLTPRVLTPDQEQKALTDYDAFEENQLATWAKQFDLPDLLTIDRPRAVTVNSAGAVLALQFAGGNRDLKQATKLSPAYFALFKNHESANTFLSLWIENDTLVLHGLYPLKEEETPNSLFAYFLNEAHRMGLKLGFFINNFYKDTMLSHYIAGLDTQIIKLEKRRNPFTHLDDDPKLYDRFVVVKKQTEPVNTSPKDKTPSLNDLIAQTNRQGGQHDVISAFFLKPYHPLHRTLLRVYETSTDDMIFSSDLENKVTHETHIGRQEFIKIFIPALLLAIKLKGQIIEVFPWQGSHPSSVQVQLTGRISGIASHAMVLEGFVTKTQTPVAIRLDFWAKAEANPFPWENQKIILKKMSELKDKLGFGFVHYYGDGFLSVDASIIESGKTLLTPQTPVVITNWAPGIHYRIWIDEEQNQGARTYKLMHQYLYHVAHITKVGLVPIDPQFMVDDQDQIHWIDFEEWEKYDPPQTHGDWQTLFDKVDHMFGIREYLRDLFGTNKIPPPWEIIERYETLATDSDFVEELAPPDDEIQPGNADINQSDTAVAHIGLVTAPVIGTGLPTTASPGIMTK